MKGITKYIFIFIYLELPTETNLCLSCIFIIIWAHKMTSDKTLQYSRLFPESIGMGFFAVDESGCVTGWDKKLSVITGISDDQAKGTSLVSNDNKNQNIFGYRARTIFATQIENIKNRTLQNPGEEISLTFQWFLSSSTGDNLLLNVNYLGIVSPESESHEYVFIVTEPVSVLPEFTGSDFSIEVLKESYELSKLYRELGNTDEYFIKMLEVLLQFSGSEYGFVGEVRQDINKAPYLVSRAITNISWNKETLEFYMKRPMVFRNLDTLFGACLKTAELVISNEPATDPRRGGLPPGHPPLNKFMGIPLKSNQRLVGMIGLANRLEGYDASLVSRLDPLLGLCADVFSVLSMSRKLKYAEDKNLLLFNNSPLMKIVTRRNTSGLSGDVIEVNESFVDCLLFDSAKVLGATTLSFFMPGSHEKINQIIKRLKSDINVSNMMITNSNEIKYAALVEMVNGKHQSVPVEVTISLAINSNGEVTGLNMICKDMSEEISERYHRTRLETEWLSLINSARVGVLSIDKDYIITEWNQAMSSLTGHEEKDVLGKLYFDYIKKDSSTDYREHLKNLMTGIVNNFSFQVDFKTKTSRDIKMMITSVAKHEEFGNIIGVRAIGQDITLLSEQAAAITQAQKMEALGLMAGGLAHDLNNILTIVKGNLELIWLEINENAEVKDMIDDALSSANDGYDITRRLMTFSRIQPIHKRDIPINSLVAGFLKILTRSLGKHISLEFKEDMSNPIVKTDASQLETALLNLVLNSRDALDGVTEGKICISIEHVNISVASELEYLDPGEYVTLTVSDNGSGMKPGVRAQALEPYFTTKPIGTGTGFGLSMVHGFSRQNGGGITISSAEGKGTSVRLYLPISTLQRRTGSGDISIIENELNSDKTQNSTNIKNILIVDDNEKVLRVITKSLQEWGFNTYTAENADAALRLLSRQPGIEVLLSDIVMHGSMSGHELATAVQKLYPDIMIILMTGYEPSSKYRDNTDLFFLYKPYSKEQFFSTLNKCELAKKDRLNQKQ